MRFRFTNNSKKVLEEIQKRVIEQHKNKDLKKFRIKYTKKKYFLVVPFPFTSPAFQLLINGKFYKKKSLIKLTVKSLGIRF